MKNILTCFCLLMATYTGKEYAIFHSGGDPGVQTLVVLLPVSGEGLVIFTNGDAGYKLYEQIITQLLSAGKEMMSRIK